MELTEIAEDDMAASIEQTVLGFEVPVVVQVVSFISSRARETETALTGRRFEPGGENRGQG